MNDHGIPACEACARTRGRTRRPGMAELVPCPECRGLFYEGRGLSKHRTMIHGGRLRDPMPCPICGKVCAGEHGVEVHVGAIHPKHSPLYQPTAAPKLPRAQQHANRIRLLDREGYSTAAIARIVSMDVTQVRSLLAGDRTSPEWVPIGRTG